MNASADLAMHDEETLPSVAIVILNWNSWPDTLECLESLLRLDYPNFSVVLCDNGSTDASLEAIENWANDRFCVLPASRDLRQMSVPPAPKPDWRLHDPGSPAQPAGLTIIQNGRNLGFAAGNNVGIRFALDRGADYVWLLNADTVVMPSALRELVKRMESDPRAGLCGSLLCYYHAPDVIQEAGGCAYYPFLGIARRIAAERSAQEDLDWRKFERRLGYVSAASTLASRRFLSEIGLMSEDYFLYCEEIDWATRGQGKFRLALAERSVVLHKKGISTGSKSLTEGRSASSAYYLWRARSRFTRKFFPLGLPGLFSVGLLNLTSEFVCGRKDMARAVFDGLFDKAR